MKVRGDYLYARQGGRVTFGVYADAGPRTCGEYPAATDHELVDARTVASWGVVSGEE